MKMYFFDYLQRLSVCNQNHHGGGSLPETVDGRCRCINNVFTTGSILSGKTYVLSRIASTCSPSPKDLIYEYNQGSSSNGQAP